MTRKTFTALFVIGTIARIAGMWIPPLWYDENFTWILAFLPFDRMLAATAGDVHPPLWYLIEWGFVHGLNDLGFAVAPWMSRIPAVVFSIASLAIVRELLDDLNIPARVRIGAMVLMAVLPMQIWYAQEARMYALLEMLVLLALLFAWRGQWAGLFITATAMLYTQNYAMLYLTVIGLVQLVDDLGWLAWSRRCFGTMKRTTFQVFKPTINTAVSLLLAALCYLPWIKVLSSQMQYIGGRYWIQEQGLGDVLNIVYKLFWASSMPSFALLTAFLATFMALSVGLIHLTYSKHPARLTILLMAFGPITLAWIISMFWHPILLHRPLIGSAVFLYIIVAYPLDKLLEGQTLKWRETVIAAALVLPVLVSGVGGYYKNIPAMKNDGAVSSTIEALTYVKAHWQPGDVIYYTDDGPLVNVLPYAKDLPQYGMAACGQEAYGLILGSLNPATRKAFGVQVADLADLTFKRAWVFAPMSPLHPKCYQEQIAPITQGEPLVTVDDNIFISSGVWLVEK
jgi:hypothetical protein